MKKIIANIFLTIIVSFGLATFALAETRNNVRIKSYINTAGTGLCLDVANGGTAEGTPIVQFTCHSGPNQRFSVVQIDASETYLIQTALITNPRMPKMCVGISNNVSYSTSTDPLRLVRCSVNSRNNPSAIWRVEFVSDPTGPRTISSYLFSQVLPTPFNCIDVPSGSNIAGMGLQIYRCSIGATNQLWRIINF